MADWQGQLADLLASLNVALDPNESVPRATDLRAESATRMAIPVDESSLTTLGGEDVSAEGDEITAVRSEIEFIVARVVRLERDGMLDRVIRDDVIYVLQGLTRPAPPLPRTAIPRRRKSDPTQEWNIASAAAVLRFCRLVHRLLPLTVDDGE
jgi:hypothetical protein